MSMWQGPLLAIESSCDESAAAVLDGTKVLSNVIASQGDLYLKYGGVVPEVAARAHVEAMLPSVIEAMAMAGCSTPSAICVTNRPGLVGSLSVGVSTAKALAHAWDVPLLGVHHLEGHILSILANRDQVETVFPYLALVVSGGHTEMVRVLGFGRMEIIAETLDDAAGEAFDKGARLLGLGYPGGKQIEEAALSGDPAKYKLPRALSHDPIHFSFSGLKTAVLRLVESQGDQPDTPSVAASLQAAIVESLASKAIAFLESEGLNRLALVGGVAANKALRQTLAGLCEKRSIEFMVPNFEYCTDNAAMIGLAGSWRLAAGQRDSYDLDVMPTAELSNTKI